MLRILTIAATLTKKCKVLHEAKQYEEELNKKNKAGRVSIHFVSIKIQKQILDVISSLSSIELAEVKKHISRQHWKTINEIFFENNLKTQEL